MIRVQRSQQRNKPGDEPRRFTFAAQRPAILATPQTHHHIYHSDKLLRLAPPSDLIERHSHCGIRGLAEGGRLAPILPRRLAIT